MLLPSRGTGVQKKEEMWFLCCLCFVGNFILLMGLVKKLLICSIQTSDLPVNGEPFLSYGPSPSRLPKISLSVWDVLLNSTWEKGVQERLLKTCSVRGCHVMLSQTSYGWDVAAWNSSRFVEKYIELQNLGETDEEKLFVETGKSLLAEGVILRRVGEARSVSILLLKLFSSGSACSSVVEPLSSLSEALGVILRMHQNQ